MTVTSHWTDPATLRIHLPAPRVCHCGDVHRLRIGEAAFVRGLAQRPYYATVTSTWTDPSEGGALDRDTGQTIRETDWDSVLSNLRHIGGTTGSISARAFHNANQSLTNGISTVLAFNSERFDTDAIHDTAVNNSRLTCKTAGKYQITVSASFAPNATGYRELLILLNGGTTIGRDNRLSVGAGQSTFATLTTVYDLAVNDFVEVQATQTSGGALNLEVISAYSPEFMMTKV